MRRESHPPSPTTAATALVVSTDTVDSSQHANKWWKNNSCKSSGGGGGGGKRLESSRSYHHAMLRHMAFRRWTRWQGLLGLVAICCIFLGSFVFYFPLTARREGEELPQQWVASTPYRCPNGPYSSARKSLHDYILQKVLEPYRQDLPSREGWILMGGPGSGKTSTIRSIFSQQSETPIRIDPDEMLPMLPEYRKSMRFWSETKQAWVFAKDAAFACHEEAQHIALLLAEKVLQLHIPFIYDGTGRNITTYEKLLGLLQQNGYHSNLILTYCPLDIALERVKLRGQNTGRFVPEEVVTNIYSVVYSNFLSLYPLVDQAYVFDASGQRPQAAWSWNKRQGHAHRCQATKQSLVRHVLSLPCDMHDDHPFP